MVILVNKNFIEIKPLFFPDTDFVVIAYENTVEVHDSQHNVIWQIEEKSKIIKLENLNDHHSQFYIALHNGEIKLCDIKNKYKTDICYLKNEITNIFLYNEDLLTVENDQIYLYPKCDISQKKVVSNKASQLVAFSSKTGIIAMAENVSITVFSVNTDQKLSHYNPKMQKTGHYTAVACHPNEHTIATADASGKILIWWDVLSSLKKSTILHWHFLSLKTIEFNHDGTHLLSGGREHVFVRWDLTVTDGERKNSFLPRLESDIDSIRPCNGSVGEYYLITLADNSYQVINTMFKSIRTYRGLIQRPKFLSQKLPKACLLNPVGLISCHNLPPEFNSSIMTNGHEGKLQLFDLKSRSTQCQIDVACQNWPTEKENYLVPGFKQVQNVAVSGCGRHLAAHVRLGVTHKNDFAIQSSVRMFKWNEESRKFESEAIVDCDSLGNLTAMVFNPVNKDHLLLLTDTLLMKFLHRNLEVDIPVWKTLFIWELTRFAFEAGLDLEKVTNNNYPSRMVTVDGTGLKPKSVLLSTKGNCLILHQWSQLAKSKIRPLLVISVDRLVEDLEMEEDHKLKMKNIIISSAILKNDGIPDCYRIVLGLRHGLMIVEIKINRDWSVNVRTISGALSEYPVKCLEKCPGTMGIHSKVAILFENSDQVTVITPWNENEKNIELIKVQSLDDVAWVPLKNKDYTLVGLKNENSVRSVAFCDDNAIQYFKSEVVIKKSEGTGINLLSLTEDVEEMSLEKKRVTNRLITKRLDRSFLLYDPKSLPSTTEILNSMYSFNKFVR